MQRSFEKEQLDGPDVPREKIARAHRDLLRTHRFLGNITVIVNALRRDERPVRSVLDIGCGDGGMLREVQTKLNVEAIGTDLRVQTRTHAAFPIVQADAVRDPLPSADVAYSVCLTHHLTGDELIAMIQNAAKSCRRLIILDLVRHRLPLILFRIFVAPFVSRLNVEDGTLSIRRAYTPSELRDLVRQALRDTGGTFRHSVAPLYARQIVDITYAPPQPDGRNDPVNDMPPVRRNW